MMRLKKDEKMIMTRPVSPPCRNQVTSREEEGNSCLTTQTFFHSALSFGHCQYGHIMTLTIILMVTFFVSHYSWDNISLGTIPCRLLQVTIGKRKLRLQSNRLKYWLMIIAINLWKLNPKMRLFWNLLSNFKVSKIATGDIDSTRHKPVFCLLVTPVNQSRLEGDQPW